jgi:hypothetical protein
MRLVGWPMLCRLIMACLPVPVHWVPTPTTRMIRQCWFSSSQGRSPNPTALLLSMRKLLVVLGANMCMARVVLPMASGALAIIENSHENQCGYDVRLEVLGSNGSMLQLVNSHQSQVVLHTPEGARKDVVCVSSSHSTLPRATCCCSVVDGACIRCRHCSCSLRMLSDLSKPTNVRSSIGWICVPRRLLDTTPSSLVSLVPIGSILLVSRIWHSRFDRVNDLL